MDFIALHFRIQCFQLCHVDSIGVFTACGYADNLAGIFLFVITYRYRSPGGFPNFRFIVLACQISFDSFFSVRQTGRSDCNTAS